MMLEHLSRAFEKWKSNAGLYDEMEMRRKEVVSVKYSDKGSFNLHKFNGRKFITKIKLCSSPEGLWENYTTYSFNQDNLLIIEDMQHVFNKQKWSGYFLYTEEETRYIVFEQDNFIPSTLQWIEWQDGKKRSWNSIRFQYGATEYWELDVVNFVQHAKRDQPASLIWACEIFNYDEQETKIETANCFYHSPGLGFFKSKKSYTYSADGELDTIRSETPQPDNSIRWTVEFSRAPKGETLRALIEQLAERMSNTILEALLREKSPNAIMQVEMYYRAVQYYIPLIQYATQEEVDKFEHSTIHDITEQFLGSQWMKHNLDWKMDEETELLYVRFFNRMSEEDNWRAGANMMYLIAKKLTSKAIALSHPNFSVNFFSYATDYEMDGHDLDKILIKCGVSKRLIKYWKKIGSL
jgi:hypothetical protein